MDFWKEYRGGTSYHIKSGVYDSHMASLSTWQYLSDFLIILPVVYSFLWKSVTKSRTHSMADGGEWGCREGALTPIIKNSPVRKACFFSPIYLFTQIYNIMDLFIYFIVWVIIQYYVAHFVSQIVAVWAVGRSPRLAPAPLWHTLLLVCFEYFLTFWHNKMFQIHFLFSLKTAISLRISSSFYWRTVCKVSIWVYNYKIKKYNFKIGRKYR